MDTVVTKVQVDAARLEALEAQMRAYTLRLHYLEQQQRFLGEQRDAETGERLELSDRLADVEAKVFPPAPAEQPPLLSHEASSAYEAAFERIIASSTLLHTYRAPNGGDAMVEPRLSLVIYTFGIGATFKSPGSVRAQPPKIGPGQSDEWVIVCTPDGRTGYIHSSLVERVP